MTSTDCGLPGRWGVYKSWQTSVWGQQGWCSAQQMLVDIQQRLRTGKNSPTWCSVSPRTYFQRQEEGEGETPEMIQEKIVRAVEWCLIQKLSSLVRKQRTPESDLYSLSSSLWLLISSFRCTNHQPLLVPRLGSALVPERAGGTEVESFGLPMGASPANCHGNWRYCDCSCWA